MVGIRAGVGRDEFVQCVEAGVPDVFERAEPVVCRLQSPAVEAVVAVSAIGPSGDERGAGQGLEVLRHLRLSEARGINELGHGQLLPLVQQLEQAAAVRFAHGLEDEIGVDHVDNIHIPSEECNGGHQTTPERAARQRRFRGAGPTTELSDSGTHASGRSTRTTLRLSVDACHLWMAVRVIQLLGWVASRVVGGGSRFAVGGSARTLSWHVGHAP